MYVTTPKSKRDILYFFAISFFLFTSYLCNGQVGINIMTPNYTKVLNPFSNANDLQSTSLHIMLTLAPNDYLEFFVGNTTDSTDFSLRTFNLVAIGMPD